METSFRKKKNSWQETLEKKGAVITYNLKIPQAEYPDTEVDFWFDCHVGADNSIPYDPDYRKITVAGGDIFCRANIKESYVPTQTSRIELEVERLGDMFLFGNHEKWRDKDVMKKLTPAVGVMHGDKIFWGDAKSEKYRNGKLGSGFLKRKVWTNALESIENGYDRKVNEEDLNRAFSVASQYGVRVLIVGHLHPRKTLIYDVVHAEKRIRLIVLKRGLTTINLSKLTLDAQSLLGYCERLS